MLGTNNYLDEALTGNQQNKLSPPQFEDFLKPDPFIYPWMLRFLPSGRRAQDFVFVGIGFLLFLLLCLAFHTLGFSDNVSAGVAIVRTGILGGEAEKRHMIAGMKFGSAKTEYRVKVSGSNKGESRNDKLA